jgi:uncharacterized pyridoxamine 5'-phosphate oxidase family protein
MSDLNEVYDYVKKAGVYFLATVDGNQPKLRPFGTFDNFEGKLYIQTGKSKDVAKQIKANSRVQIGAIAEKGSWIRIEATLVEDDRVEAKQHMLDSHPSLKKKYSATDDSTLVLYLKDATAVITAAGSEPKTIKF